MELEKVAFMGKITAGATHEIKNVLAIIKESAGLLEDLISFTQEGQVPPRDKCMRSLTRIADQVARGVDVATNLNAFAHTSDEEAAGTDLNQAILQSVRLCRRFARLKSITLKALPHARPVVVTTDPLAFQMLLFQCVDLLMSVIGPGGVITLHSGDASAGRVVISAETEKANADTDREEIGAGNPAWQAVQAVAADLDVSVEAGGPPPFISVRFMRRQQ